MTWMREGNERHGMGTNHIRAGNMALWSISGKILDENSGAAEGRQIINVHR